MRRATGFVTTMIAALLATGSSLPAGENWTASIAEATEPLLGPDDYFSAAVVQNGRLFPVRNAGIRLRPEPFAVLIVTRGPAGVLVNASPEPDFYDGVRANLPLTAILDEPAMLMGMAEYYLNEERSLFVSEIFPHYVVFTSQPEHRYDFVHLTRHAVIGYRTVEYLLDMETTGALYPVSEWRAPL